MMKMAAIGMGPGIGEVSNDAIADSMIGDSMIADSMIADSMIGAT